MFILILSFCFVNGEYRVSSFKLPNGLRVILSPSDGIEATCVLFYHLTGARDDPAEARGCSYLYKNLMFSSTQNLDPYEHIRFVKKNGGMNDSRINYDSSVFFQVIPDTKINYALWLEKERITSLLLTDRSMSLLKDNLYRRIYRLTNTNVNFRAVNWIKPIVFEGTVYQTPAYGNVEEIRSLDNQSIRKVYDNFRNPANIILVVTGKFNEAEIKKIIIKHFSQLYFRSRPNKKNYVSIKPRNKYVYKNWLLEGLNRNFAVYGIRAPSKFSYDHLYFDFIRYYLVDKRISRLEKMLNHINDLKINISYEYTDNFESNALIITISTKKRINLEKAKYVLSKELVALGSKPISSSDLKVTRSLMEIDFMKDMSVLEKRGVFLAEYFHLTGNLNYEETYSRRIKKISSYDIIRISKEYLKKENLVILNVYSK